MVPSITDLIATTALNVVKNEVPNDSDIVKKAKCDAKRSDIEKMGLGAVKLTENADFKVAATDIPFFCI